MVRQRMRGWKDNLQTPVVLDLYFHELASAHPHASHAAEETERVSGRRWSACPVVTCQAELCPVVSLRSTCWRGGTS
jgi:hypothetical protein